MSTFQFSIIITAYNEEEYISEALDSLFNQSIHSKYFEVLFVDDLSNDNTLEVVKKYEKEENFIVIKNLTNEGLGYSRNNAIERAAGKYLIFLDADDLLFPNALKKISNLLENVDSDIVVFNWIEYSNYKNKNFYKENSFLINTPIAKDDIVDSYLGLSGVDYTNNYKVVKKSIFDENNLLYSKGYHEDISMTFKLYFLAKSIYIFDEIIYIRRLRENSITGNFNKKHIIGLFTAWNEMLEFLQKKSYSKKNIYTYHKGISGVIANIIGKIIVKKDKLNLYNELIYLVKNNQYMVQSKIPKKTRKDYITGVFLSFIENKDNLQSEEINIMENKYYE